MASGLNLGHLEVFLGLNNIGLTKGLTGSLAAMEATAVKMQTIGKKMFVALSLPLGIMGGMAITAFAKFEKAMNQVAAVTLGTQKQMGMLEAQARQLGATTKYTAVQAAEGMNFLAMAGFKVNEILAAMPTVLNLAAAGNMDLGRAADIVSNIMRGFGLEAEHTAEVADILTATFTNSNASLEQIGESMAFAAPVAKAFGQSIGSTAAMVGALGDAGIQASRAGTAVRQMLLQLDKHAGDLGIQVRDTNGDFLEMEDILWNIEKAGIRADTAIATVGPRAGVALAAMLERGSRELSKFTTEVELAQGLTDSIAKTQLTGLYGAWVEMTSAATEFRISIGSFVGPTIEALVDKVKALFVSWEQVSTENKKLVVMFTAVATAIGPVVFLIGKLIGIGRTLVSTFIAIWSSGAGPVILAMSLIGAAVWYIYDNWEAFKERMTDWAWWRNLILDMQIFMLKYNGISLLVKAWNWGVQQIAMLWDKVTNYIAGSTWWKQLLIDMNSDWSKWNPFKEIWEAFERLGVKIGNVFGNTQEEIDAAQKRIDEFNADKKPLEWGQIDDPFAPLAFGLEDMKVKTKEYEHQFKSVTDSMKTAAGEVKQVLIGLYDSVMGPVGGAQASGYEGKSDAVKEMMNSIGNIDKSIKRTRVSETFADWEYNAKNLTGTYKTLDDGTQEFTMNLDAVNAGIRQQQLNLQGLLYNMDDSEEATGRLATALQNALNGALVGLGETLGNIFSGDAGAATFFEGILATVASFMSALGKALIAAGVASEAFKNLIENPWLAIAAGVALVAASTVVANMLKRGPKGGSGGEVKGLASGGMVTKGGVFKVHKQELVTLPMGAAVTPATMAMGGGGQRGGRLYTEISGTTLRFILDEEDRRQGNTR